MPDKITKLGKSTIQHGDLNDRIYLMKLNTDDLPGLVEKLDELSEEKRYSKIFAKVPTKFATPFLNNEYDIEAYIPNFYNGKDDALFLGKFNSDDRKKQSKKELREFQSVLKNVKKESEKEILENIIALGKDSAEEMSQIYSNVFKNYPFPVEDAEYIRETMDNNIKYFGIKKEGKLVALSSSEMYLKNGNVEMTDFAVLPKHRGNGYSLQLLKYMEEVMGKKGIKTAYTIARLKSLGMNKTFLKNGYKYSGTLAKNTKISTGLESMNVLYKEL